MRVFAMKSFRRFQRKEGLADGALLDTIQRAERELIDAPLGGGLIKQRAARRGQGRSGGYRVIADIGRAPGPSSCTALRRTRRTILQPTNWPPCGRSLTIFCTRVMTS